MTQELKAGMLVLAAIGAMLYMVHRLTRQPYAPGEAKTYFALVDNATGLLHGSKVKVAGINVGEVAQLEIQENQALLVLRISAPVMLREDARIVLRMLGFLGDRYVELWPGTTSKPPLPERSYIPRAEVEVGLERLTSRSAELVDDLADITGLLESALRGSPGGQDADSRIGSIVSNMERFSEQLAALENLGSITDDVGDAAENVSEIAEKINSGQGTIGKLVTETETIDRINSTLSGVDRLMDSASEVEFSALARGTYLSASDGGMSQFALLFQPALDKYFLLGASLRPSGIIKTEELAPDQTIKITESTDFKVDLQFAQRLSDFTFRLGLFEGTAGAGIDYAFASRRIRFFGEIYRFRADNPPQLNLGIEALIYRPFTAWAGGDFITSDDNRGFFVGAGLRFTLLDFGNVLDEGE